MILHRPVQQSVRAFTLIEVLLAVTIFGIVLVAMNTVFYSALRLRTTTARVLDESQPVQQAVSILRRDLLSTVQPGGVLAGDFKLGSVVGGLGMAGNNKIEFYTASGVITADAPWGDIQMVSYGLRDPADRTSPGKDLVRSVTRNLLTPTTQQPDEQWLMGNVASLEFDCYDGNDWRSSWDTSMGDSGLPNAVRIRIQLATANGASNPNRQPMEIIVPLESQSITNSTQLAAGGAQ